MSLVYILLGNNILKFSLKSDLENIIKTHLKGFKFSLSKLEIQRIINYPFKKRLSKIRDAFVFALYTKLSFKVIKDLSKRNYRKLYNEKDALLVRNQYKKLQWVDISTLPTAIRDCCLKTEDFLFPLPSIQKANAYLKEIAEICTDAKYLSFYSSVACYRNNT